MTFIAALAASESVVFTYLAVFLGVFAFGKEHLLNLC